MGDEGPADRALRERIAQREQADEHTRERARRRSKDRLGLGLCVLGVVLAVSGALPIGNVIARYHRLITEGEKARGVVRSAEAGYVDIAYRSADGVSRAKFFRVDRRKGIESGDVVTVFYDPEDPAQATIREEDRYPHRGGPTLLFFLPLPGMLLAAYGIAVVVRQRSSTPIDWSSWRPVSRP